MQALGLLPNERIKMTTQLLREADLVNQKATARTPAKRGLISMSRSTLWRLIRKGQFPAGRKSNEINATFWRADEVQAWIDAQ
jgi:predicted DNA-binding transcriptional regulator AlpA